jgi:hypothetical protein
VDSFSHAKILKKLIKTGEGENGWRVANCAVLQRRCREKDYYGQGDQMGLNFALRVFAYFRHS